jgi:hypothetical protein
MVVPPNIRKILRKCVCPQCGETLVFGRWKHYFEYVALTPDECSRRDYGKDRSEGWHLKCPLDDNHSIASILDDAENETLHDFVTALRAIG